MVAAAIATAGCDDSFTLPWATEPALETVYVVSNPVSNIPTAFDFIFRTAVQIEVPGATGTWDVAFDAEGDGFQLLPAGALGVAESEAGVIRMDGLDFPEVASAPDDSDAYVSDRAVTLELGVVYVVRTREGVGFYGETCNWYAKLEPTELNAAGGFVRFLYDVNPNCNDRSLVPPS